MPDNLSLSSLKSGTVPNGPKALRDMTFAISRVPRDILGNPAPRCCTEVVCRPSPAGGSHKFGRLIIFLHPLWTMEGWNMEGRQAAQITAYFFPAFSARRSFRRARHASDAMRCAFVQRSQFARFRPASRGPYRSRRSKKWFGGIRRRCSRSPFVASFLNPVTLRE